MGNDWMNSLLKRYSIVTRRTFVDWIKFKNLIFLKPFPKTPSAVPTCHLLEKRWTELLCNFVIPPLPSYRACMNNFFSSETRGKRNCRHYLPLSSVAVLQATTRSVKMEKSFPGSHRLTIFKKSSAICPWEFLIWRFACVTKSRLKRFFSGCTVELCKKLHVRKSKFAGRFLRKRHVEVEWKF